ncbi:MAG: metallophosphoesterase [Spirochaetota bacterium]|nr:metallophosphoesterase [Spirochaetota bacterium]
MLFIIIVLIIFTSIYLYVGLRVIIPADLTKKWNIISWSAIIFFYLLPIISILQRIFGFQEFHNDVISMITYISLGFIILLLLLLLFRDSIWLFLNTAKKFFKKAKSIFFSKRKPKVDNSLNIDRRRFLEKSCNIALLGVSGVLSGYGFIESRKSATIEEVLIPFPGLTKDFNNLRIVQISDLHIGITIKRNFVQRVVDQVNSLSPDIIVITGDIVDRSVAHLKNDVSPLSELSSSYGTYFVTGNHEYYSGVESWLLKFKELGFTILNNEHAIIKHRKSHILLAGVTDYSGSRFSENHNSDPQAAILGSPNKCDIKILLAHQPRSIFNAASAGFDLQISGHTHGGQFFPWNYLVRLQQPFITGLHKYKNTWVYVNRGTGYWGPPLRIGVPSEITLIKLNSEINA